MRYLWKDHIHIFNLTPSGPIYPQYFCHTGPFYKQGPTKKWENGDCVFLCFLFCFPENWVQQFPCYGHWITWSLEGSSRKAFNPEDGLAQTNYVKVPLPQSATGVTGCPEVSRRKPSQDFQERRWRNQIYDSFFWLPLASSGPYGPVLARSGYPEQDANFL